MFGNAQPYCNDEELILNIGGMKSLQIIWIIIHLYTATDITWALFYNIYLITECEGSHKSRKISLSLVSMPENKVEFGKAVIQTEACNRRLDQMWTCRLDEVCTR